MIKFVRFGIVAVVALSVSMAYAGAPPGPSYSPTYSISPSGGYGGMSGGLSGGFGFGGANPVGFGAPEPAANFDENDPATAWVTLDLPHEQSEVWLNGLKMPHKGLVRKYVTPPLKQGLVYNYDVKVQWPNGAGGKNTYSTTLQFKAGDEVLHKVAPVAQGVPQPNQEQQPIDEQKQLAQRLDWAKTLIKEGKVAKAKERLQEIFEKSPDSPVGKEAKSILDGLK